MKPRNRREFLADVGSGMLTAGVGASLFFDMGLTPVRAADAYKSSGQKPTGDKTPLNFGELEPLVSLMQDTAPEKLQPLLVAKIRAGGDLRTLIAAGALANARTFAGEDYIGYHTFMALAPAYDMSRELPAADAALPVLKVLYRNSARIQAHGGHKSELLHAIEAAESSGALDAQTLRQKVHARDRAGAERVMEAMVRDNPGEAYQHLQFTVQDEVNVHRIVLAWRAWAILDLVGKEHAAAMLRQSVRFCVQSEQNMHERKYSGSPIRTQLPKLFDQYKLAGRNVGTRTADDKWLADFANLVYSGSPATAAEAAAAALAEGFSADSIGEGLSLAANLLVLRDPGRDAKWSDEAKPAGSCHGDSPGVHASDAANAWRNIVGVSNPRNALAGLIVGAYHTAGQSGRMYDQSLPSAEHRGAVKGTDPTALLTELDDAIRAKDQSRSVAVATKYGEADGKPRAIFDVLLKYATSEDGALHAEKYYRTVVEEFGRSRPAFRWRQVAALARVTASEYGRTAPGYNAARELLKG
jgi:hypothetical protein